MGDLVDELVKSQEPVAPKPSTPKRNSKDCLIQKIVSLAEEMGEDLPETNSQLKRMSKKALGEKLAEMVEKRIEFEAHKTLGISKEQSRSPALVNLAALKMVHNIAVTSAENIVERTSEKHGMTLAGFADRMKSCQESIDEILLEIAELYPEVLENFQSPWVRLGLLWTSNVIVTLKKKKGISKSNKNVTEIRFEEPQGTRTI